MKNNNIKTCTAHSLRPLAAIQEKPDLNKKLMNYNGIWTNTKSGEEIKITNLVNSDEYILEWDKSESGYKKEQKTQISIGNTRHSHLPYSEKFGEAIIFNIDDNTFEINGEQFKRLTNF